MIQQKQRSPGLFYQIDVEALIPEDHFLRKLDRLLNKLQIGRQLRGLYNVRFGRPAIDPEVMVRILLLGYLYGLSENRLFQELKLHLGYRWFCRLAPDDRVPDRSTLNKLRNHRWAMANVVEWLMSLIVQQCIDEGLVKGDHLGMDGTQVRANASIQSFEPILLQEKVEDYLKRFMLLPEKLQDDSCESDRSGNDPDVGGSSPQTGRKAGKEPLSVERGTPKKPGDFHGEKLSNRTHRSKTDPDALLFRKGKNKEAHLSYLMHDLADLDSGVILARSVTQARGALEREAALEMLDDELSRYRNISFKGAIVEGDKNYCTREFIYALKERGYKPLISVRENLKEQTIPAYKRGTRDPVLLEKRLIRKKMARAVNEFLSECRSPFGWPTKRRRILIERLFAEAKALGMARTRYRGLAKVSCQALLVACAQNLRRLISYLDRRGPRVKPAASFFRAISLTWTHFLRKIDHLFCNFADFLLGSLNMDSLLPNMSFSQAF